jgi:hypothetical protein
MRALLALIYEYGEGAWERRDPYRPAHLELIERWHQDGRLVIAGALGDPAYGALLGFDVEDPAEVEQFAASDPYVTEGIVSAHRVEPWTVVTP